MKVDQKRGWNVTKRFVVAGATMALVAGMATTVPSAYAAGTIKADDDKWISLGMGTRTSFNMVEDGSANRAQYSNSFGVNNARIYINGKIHKYVGFEFNTDAAERMDITAGECRVRQAGQSEWKKYRAGDTFNVPSKSSFEIAVDSGLAEYVCSFE